MKALSDGTCEKNPEHTWKKDDELFLWPKSGTWDDKSQGYLKCNNKDCFIAQGGKITQKKGGGSWGRPVKTAKEMIEDIPHFDQVLYEVVRNRLKKIQEESGETVSQEVGFVFMESWARTLVQASK